MICVVRIIYLFGIFQSRILLLFTFGRQHSFGASEWFARLINGLLSLIRFGDDLDELLLGGLQMRLETNLKEGYVEFSTTM